jgi:broad specificity phosphatase PhoE
MVAGVQIIFETHSTSTDNEAGIASGWRDPALSELGRAQAAELGDRRRGSVSAVYCSDLTRAVETAEIAFGGTLEIRTDARLREYDYGEMTGAPPAQIAAERPSRVDVPFNGGESLRDVTARVESFLEELSVEAIHGPVLLIGHSATYMALEHLLNAQPLEEIAAAAFRWQPGWTFRLPSD